MSPCTLWMVFAADGLNGNCFLSIFDTPDLPIQNWSITGVIGVQEESILCENNWAFSLLSLFSPHDMIKLDPDYFVRVWWIVKFNIYIWPHYQPHRLIHHQFWYLWQFQFSDEFIAINSSEISCIVFSRITWNLT